MFQTKKCTPLEGKSKLGYKTDLTYKPFPYSYNSSHLSFKIYNSNAQIFKYLHLKPACIIHNLFHLLRI